MTSYRTSGHLENGTSCSFERCGRGWTVTRHLVHHHERAEDCTQPVGACTLPTGLAASLLHLHMADMPQTEEKQALLDKSCRGLLGRQQRPRKHEEGLAS